MRYICRDLRVIESQLYEAAATSENVIRSTNERFCLRIHKRKRQRVAKSKSHLPTVFHFDCAGSGVSELIEEVAVNRLKSRRLVMNNVTRIRAVLVNELKHR